MRGHFRLQLIRGHRVTEVDHGGESTEVGFPPFVVGGSAASPDSSNGEKTPCAVIDILARAVNAGRH